ncbi:hypothetical protein [Archangium sp.]|uniref:hypothetical protein n=1 Tax=Archangium sp. TaxID=1872627 RepID=UPI002D639A5B|nr:hypothetical protein [Archangium sp.]HYO57545.1 hypothetical protein [Archangium sp.]
MQLALLRLAGPRLEAAMLGSILLAGWLDFLNLVDIVLKQGFNSLETLFVHLDRWQKMLEPAMTALSSLEPGQVEAAAKDLPALMGHLSGEFNSTAETIRVAMKRGEQTMLLAQLVEMVTLVSALKISLPRLPPSAPATLGVGLVEWFEKRGFTGEMSIDRFCVKMERAHHEAIHGGGDWRLGRMWPGEWNQMIMEALRDAEMLAGRMLTRNEILERVAFYMKRYNIPMNFTPWRGR